MQTRVMLAATFSRFRGATAARLVVPSQRMSQISLSVFALLLRIHTRKLAREKILC